MSNKANPLVNALKCVFVSLVIGFTALGAGNVYVVTDGYKILPDGTILEFNQKPPNLFTKENLIWNSDKKEIRIAGARNEVIAFQIVMDGAINDVRLENEILRGPGVIPAKAVTYGVVGFISYKNRFFPDVVIPLDAAIMSSFSVPYQTPGLLEIPNQKVGVVMVEVAIPDHTSSGEYTGRIIIKGGLNEILNLRLTVWDFDLPKAPSLVFEFNSYSSPVKSVLEDQRNPYRPTPATIIAAEHEFYRCADRHRAYLNIIPVHSQRGRPHYAPALTGQGTEVKCDWTHWDERFGPVLNGSIFDSGVPPPYFYLPFNLHWPWGYSHDENLEDRRLNWRDKPEYKQDHTFLITQEYLDEWEAVARQTIAHFAEIKWKQTTFQVYMNHSNQENANSPWRLDEPYDRWDFQVLSYFADLTDKLFQNNRGISVKYRLDIGHFHCRADSIRCYKAKKYDLPLGRDGGGPQLLEPTVDQWYIGGPHVWGNREKVTEVGTRDPDKEMFVYGGGQQVHDGTIQHRSLFWYLYDFNMGGYCSWNQGCRDPDVPLDKPGAAHVWYSGKKFGFSGPLPSLRMKSWRRGSYDVEYLKLAEAKASREHVMAIFTKLCEYKRTHRKYKHVKFPFPNNNPHNFEIARLKLASMILGKDVTASHDFLGTLPSPTHGFTDQIRNY